MNYVTTTQLRTKSSQLVNSLSRGQTVSLIHRSKIIGEIKPKKETKPITTEDISELKKLALALNLAKMTYSDREKKYRKHLVNKYGQGIS